MVARGYGREGELMLNRFRGSLWEGEIVLEMDGGDGYMTM